MPDRPSREYRLAHGPDGLTLLEPVSDPPDAPEEPTLPAPAAAPRRASLAPSGIIGWGTMLGALLGAGGLGGVVQAWRGDGETAEALAALTVQVQVLTGQVARLESAQIESGKDLAKLKGQLEPLANLRGQMSAAESHLRQPPRPDVPGALKALDSE